MFALITVFVIIITVLLWNHFHLKLSCHIHIITHLYENLQSQNQYVIISLWLLPKCFSGGILKGGKSSSPKSALGFLVSPTFSRWTHSFAPFSNLTAKSLPNPPLVLPLSTSSFTCLLTGLFPALSVLFLDWFCSSLALSLSSLAASLALYWLSCGQSSHFYQLLVLF